MSVTRILCDKCGYPLAWCECKKPDAPLVDGASESQPTEARCAVATGWPGLIFWLGEGFFRTLGYLVFVLAGYALAKHESFIAVIGAFALGHFSVCTAEVIDQMAREEKDNESSANK